MTALKEALEFISEWVQQYMPDHPAVMNQGLSREVINAKVRELPFQLPEEVCELYQWRNGGKNPFIPHPDIWDMARFFSLEESIDVAQGWKTSGDLFLLFMVEDRGYFTICTEEKLETAPIYYSDTLEGVLRQEPRYSSLTSMMQELVEELKNRRIEGNNITIWSFWAGDMP